MWKTFKLPLFYETRKEKKNQKSQFYFEKSVDCFAATTLEPFIEIIKDLAIYSKFFV